MRYVIIELRETEIDGLIAKQLLKSEMRSDRSAIAVRYMRIGARVRCFKQMCLPA